jgi:hypothetical protein
MAKAKSLKINVPLMDSQAIEANQNGWLTDAQRKPATLSRVGCIIASMLYVSPALLIFFVLLPLHWKQVIPGPALSNWADSLGVYCLLLCGVICGVFGLRLISWLIRTQRELAEPAIATVEGQVIYNQRTARYQASIPRLKLFNIEGSTEVLLPPGVYRFYYLPIARRLLSGEWLRPNEPGGPSTEILRALMHTNGFTAEDLALNQRGQLSPGQQEKLFDKKKNRVGGSPQFHLHLQTGLAERTKGDLDDSDYWQYIWPHLRIGVPERAYYALIPGLPYRVYYVTSPLRLLSIELLLESSQFFGSTAAEAL